jgi:multicomponent Na+:H+ antiporter subunit A
MPLLAASTAGAGGRGRPVGWWLAIAPFLLFVWFVSTIPEIGRGSVLHYAWPWAADLGLILSFRIDGLSLMFALLITGIGTLIVIYAGGYLAGHHHLGRFYLFLFMFMGSMLGMVVSENVVALFIFWELTSITSYLLIGMNHEEAGARAAALQALLVTGLGGLALMAGLILLATISGSYELTTILASGDLIRGHALYLPALLLVLFGAFTKSAQFPFHFWLPNAMAAPTPVSAYLHSATMVKAGVFLLARLSEPLGGTVEWTMIVTTVGAITMLLGGYLAVTAIDLKQILAYSTVSALGTLVLLLGIGTSGAVKACVVFLFAHALYKGALFMVAGAVDHETGTRDVDKMGGLRTLMPITATVAVIAAVSLAGFGPVLSFIGKEMVFESLPRQQQGWFILAPAMVLTGGMFAAVAGIVALRPFFGRRRETPKTPHEAPLSLWLGPAILAGAGVILGLIPGPLGRQLISPAVASILGYREDVYLALWHGFNAALGMSAISLLIGALFYYLWEHFRRFHGRLDWIIRWGPLRWYELSLDALNGVAKYQTRILQNGYLRWYLLMIILSTVGLAGYVLFSRADVEFTPNFSDVYYYEVGVGLFILAGTLTAVMSKSRLGAVAALGVVGYSVALVYVIFGAPDLAMTQFLIETLTVILFVLVLYHLPRFANLSSPPARIRDIVVSLAVGILMGGLVLATSALEVEPLVSEYFAETAVPGGHGRNIVNVILVDFRATDTLGEIVVLAVAAIGVFALLKLRMGRKEEA